MHVERMSESGRLEHRRRLLRSVARGAMQPIRDLLNQIRWDPNFRGEFEIAFVDRAKPELQRVSLRDLRFDADSSFSFQLFDPEGRLLSIPLHRIRKVYRDGALIWSRADED
jgi:uncharacterized protein (UPF0248 family)